MTVWLHSINEVIMHSPLSALNDLLAARELELGTAKGFFSVISIAFLVAHRK